MTSGQMLATRSPCWSSLVAVLVWSGIAPHDRFTWWLEVAPVLIGVPIADLPLAALPLHPPVYTLLWIHAVILMVGGQYTYAEVPLGFWMQDAFGFARNHYDRHRALRPGIRARRCWRGRSSSGRSPLRGSRWLPFVVVCFCLAFSALYELIEFWTALATGEAARGVPGHAGRRVGHAVGHADGAGGGDHRAGDALGET